MNKISKVTRIRRTPAINAVLEALDHLLWEADNEECSEKEILQYVREHYPQFSKKEVREAFGKI